MRKVFEMASYYPSLCINYIKTIQEYTTPIMSPAKLYHGIYNVHYYRKCAYISSQIQGNLIRCELTLCIPVTDPSQSWHLLMVSEQRSQQVAWPHGTKTISLNASPQTRHWSYLGSSWDSIDRFLPATCSWWLRSSNLRRPGSEQRSRGVWPLVFLIEKSAPLVAKKMAMEEAAFLWALVITLTKRRLIT